MSSVGESTPPVSALDCGKTKVLRGFLCCLANVGRISYFLFRVRDCILLFGRSANKFAADPIHRQATKSQAPSLDILFISIQYPNQLKLSRWSLCPTQVSIWLSAASRESSRRHPPRRHSFPTFPDVTVVPMGKCSSGVANRERRRKRSGRCCERRPVESKRDKRRRRGGWWRSRLLCLLCRLRSLALTYPAYPCSPSFALTTCPCLCQLLSRTMTFRCPSR